MVLIYSKIGKDSPKMVSFFVKEERVLFHWGKRVGSPCGVVLRDPTAATTL